MSQKGNTTLPSTRERQVFGVPAAEPGLLIAHAPLQAVTADRCLVRTPFTIGRAPICDLPVHDRKMSKAHFRIDKDNRGYWIEDLGSTNGTFVQGVRVETAMPLPDQGVIRAGQTVVVFCADIGELLRPPPAERYGLAGRFHTGALIQQMREAAESSRHVLLSGPSGSGKEITARALATLMGTPSAPLSFLAHNAARFSSEEEATSTLFGVAARIFSNVSARPGLIEEAGEGVLFLDEVHNLPERVQRSLLRVIEDGQTSRIGEIRPRPTSVRFLLASNMPPPEYGLAHDLLARLRVVRIPPLQERVADIPVIFEQLLADAIQAKGLPMDAALAYLSGDHFEAMCLDRFPLANVRGLLDLADRLVSRIATGVAPDRAVASVFAERFGANLVAIRRSSSGVETFPASRSNSAAPASTGQVPEAEGSSHYEAHREAIIAAYRKCGGNLSATERLLLSSGIPCSRRWLRRFVKKWGLRE